MANAKQCDRCGAFYKENTRFPKVAGLCKTFLDGVCFTTKNGDYADYLDLCDDCIAKFKLFMSGTDLKEENV